jgi:hypothetical protein
MTSELYCDVFGWYTPLIRRVLVRLIGFISSWVTHSLVITPTYMSFSAISVLRTFQITVAHALGFSVSTSRLLAMDLDTQTITVPHFKYYTEALFTTHAEN